MRWSEMALELLPLIYLDWNVFDGLSKGKFSDLGKALIKARDEGIIHIPYSEWHLYEAVNVSDREELAVKNLEAIREHTNMVFIWDNKESPDGWAIFREQADRVFDIDTAQKIVGFSETLKPIFAALTVVRDQVTPYGLVTEVLNNYSPHEVIQEINKILLKPENIEKYKEYAPDGVVFEDLIQLSLQLMGDELDDLYRVAGIYFMIDQLGYHTDRSVKSNVMSLWRDAMHVAWASRTQILISNDRRLRMKAKLTYIALGIYTLVLDPDSGLIAIEGIIENGDDIKLKLQEYLVSQPDKL